MAGDKMRKSKVTFETVRKVGLTLPGVEDKGGALKVGGKLLAWEPQNRDSEPDSFVVRLDPEDRAELLAADPAVYYVTNHYFSYNAMLIRLSHVQPDALRDLLGMAHKFVTREPLRLSKRGSRRLGG
jgi:hypothetical protein